MEDSRWLFPKFHLEKIYMNYTGVKGKCKLLRLGGVFQVLVPKKGKLAKE